MKLITCEFDYDDGRAPSAHAGAYAELSRVFRASCARNMPGVTFEEIKMRPPAGIPGKRTAYTSNNAKLREWEKAVRAAGEPLILSDCDMLCLQSVEDAFHLAEWGGYETPIDQPWDIAYTQTSNPRLPINGGVIFVRPTAAAKAFFRRWREVDLQMYRDPVFHEPWRRATCGMNQASFWYLVKKELPQIGARVIALPCREWNACQDDWADIGPECRMLHVKGTLRWAVLGSTPVEDLPPELRKAARIWREYRDATL
ncbi:MAG TPA: putative nucleotide-diphospho-sugar transferase [Coriobacteriia bacterium]|nr:putative nucleotide-diphospho-sugar transferase [Coriobacteriia bacterium]